MQHRSHDITAQSTLLDFLVADGELTFPHGSTLIRWESERNADCALLIGNTVAPDYISLRFFDEPSSRFACTDAGMALLLADTKVFPALDKRIADSLSIDSTILDFLLQGGELTFSNGVQLIGDRDNGMFDRISYFNGFVGDAPIDADFLALALDSHDLFPESQLGSRLC